MKLRDEVALEINEPLISEDHTEVTIPATLTVWAKGEGKEEPFMEISMHQHLTITINPEHFSEEILQAYIVRNAVLNLVSVFREHVKYATFQMGLPPLILPAFKITPPGKENESQEGADTDAP
ncbi:MAG: hypothetical protein D6681_05780 [Calditrichaeota bacterium]|nr:MAG: hypothetical protein D6681_05780 [Calditrichota bacterium]